MSGNDYWTLCFEEQLNLFTYGDEDALPTINAEFEDGTSRSNVNKSRDGTDSTMTEDCCEHAEETAESVVVSLENTVLDEDYSLEIGALVEIESTVERPIMQLELDQLSSYNEQLKQTADEPDKNLSRHSENFDILDQQIVMEEEIINEPNRKRARGRPIGSKTKKSSLSQSNKNSNGTTSVVNIICPLCKRSNAKQTIVLDEANFYLHLKTAHGLFKTAIGNGCKLCHDVILSRQDFIDHVTNAHYDGLLTCPLCQQTVRSTSEVTEHINLHYQNVCTAEREICPFCQLNFSVYDLSGHVITKHAKVQLTKKPVTLHRCLMCSTRFQTFNRLAQHVCPRLHVDQTDCAVCRLKFPSRKRLTFHMQTHLNSDFTFRCDICPLSFVDEDAFYNHIRFTHEIRNDFKCEICDATFSCKISFYNHRHVHTASRMFECKTCGKRFLNERTLEQHKFVHDKIKPYLCNICGKNLSGPSRLRIHLRAHSVKSCNDSQLCYSCNSCGFSSSNGTDLSAHKCIDSSSVNDVNYKLINLNRVLICEFCYNHFDNRHSLRQHVEQIHPESHEDGHLRYICNKCDIGFISFARLSTHRLAHGINVESRNLSKDKQSYQTEFIIPQIFGCLRCDRVYNDHSCLNAHRKKCCPKKTAYKVDNSKSNETTRHDEFNKENFLLDKHDNNNIDVDDNLDFDGKIKFICSYCDKRYERESFYMKHLLLHHPEQQRPSRQRLIDRNKTAADKRRMISSSSQFETKQLRSQFNGNSVVFVCEVCDGRFNDESDYKLHKFIYH